MYLSAMRIFRTTAIDASHVKNLKSQSLITPFWGVASRPFAYPNHVYTSRIHSRFNSTISPSSSTSPTKPSPEELIKRGHQAEVQQEKDDQDNVQETTGVIEKSSREGLIYFSNMYPVLHSSSETVSRMISFVFGLTEANVNKILSQHAIPDDFPVKFSKVIPRYKDGGVFARFTISPDAPEELTPKDVESVLYSHLKEHQFRPLFNPFRKVYAYAVRGVPWIEDLHRRVSRKVRVIFEGEDLSPEILYSFLRRYGPIKDITNPTAENPKEPIKSSVVEYVHTRDASTARNCVNSLVVNNTKIHITYVPVENANIIQKSIVDHPRIAIPIILALLAALAVLVFNPIRIWFIERKVTDSAVSSYFDNLKIVTWFRGITNETFSRIGRYFHFSSEKSTSNFEALWVERQDVVRKIRQWLNENVNTFIVVNGPRGNGKRELVTKFVLQDRSNVLKIDCDQLIKAQNDTSFIRLAAGQLGYYPVFPWMNNLATYLDLIIQGLTGQKSGFAESTEQQFKTMLTTTTSALRRIALENYQNAAKEEGIRESTEGCNSNVNSRNALTEEGYLQLHAEAKPVVVISHFLNRLDSSHQFVYKYLADFAATLIQTNLAHVIFITNDVTYESVLQPSLPNQMFKVATVGDADTKDAKAFVLNQIVEARRTAQWVRNNRTNNTNININGQQPYEQSPLDDIVKEAQELERAKNELKEQEEKKRGNIGRRILNFATGAFRRKDTEQVAAAKAAAKAAAAAAAALEEDKANEEKNLFDEETLNVEFPYLDYALPPLGGRLTDLQAFARRLKSGENPLDAAEDMVEQSASEILEMFLFRTQRYPKTVGVDTTVAGEWTQEQSWTLIKLLGTLSSHPFTKERELALAKVGMAPGSDRGESKINKNSNITHDPRDCEPELSLSFLLIDPNFKTRDQLKALVALQQAEMIRLVNENGRVVAIKAGKPLYQAAFRSIIDDKVLFAIHESKLLETLIVNENKKIEKYEEELRTLAKIPSHRELRERMWYTVDKLKVSQDKIAKYEQEFLKQRQIMGGK